MKNVLIVGVARDSSARKTFEDDFVTQLKQHKVAAFPSYLFFPGDKLPSKEAVSGIVKEKGIDTVLVTRVTDQKDVQQNVPGGYAYASPYRSYWGYYGYGWGYAHSPGYTVTNTEVVLESNLYNVESDTLEWTATSKTTTQGDRIDVIRSFIPAIVEKMGKDKLF